MSDNIEYQPIHCALYDGFELACMRKEVHKLTWSDQGQTYTLKLQCLNLQCEQGAEYLIAESQEHAAYKIRLDHITSTLAY